MWICDCCGFFRRWCIAAVCPPPRSIWGSAGTISTHIGELEARLGTRLCQRGRGGFALTARGKKIYEASLGLMQSLESFRNEVNAEQDLSLIHI